MMNFKEWVDGLYGTDIDLNDIDEDEMMSLKEIYDLETYAFKEEKMKEMKIVLKESYELKAFVAPKSGNYCYAIIKRNNCPLQPYVFCSGYDVTDGSWGAGYYFDTYEEAAKLLVKYMK